MKSSRDAAILVLVSIAFGISLAGLARVVGLTSPLFVMVATCDFMALIAIARPWFVLKLPRPLQPVRAWEVRGDLYRPLGVAIFGAMLRGSPLRYLNPTVYLNNRSGDSAAVCTRMEAAEATHLWAIGLTIPYVLYVGIQNRWSALVWFMIFNVGVNVYPVLHLRWIRGRLTRVLEAKLLIRSRTRLR